MNWQEFEDNVRRIASSKWNAPAKPEEIAGVRCDAVVRVSPEEFVVIEITKEKSLSKLRTDLAKFASISRLLKKSALKDVILPPRFEGGSLRLRTPGRV